MKILLCLSLFLVSSLSISACPKVEFNCGGKYQVHLSFDDGPDKNTTRILNTLKDENIKASFYPLGRKLIDSRGDKLKSSQEKFKILDRMMNDGHIVGTHTFTHIHHYNVSRGKGSEGEERLLDKHNIDWRDNIDIVRQSEALRKYHESTGDIYFRFPYGQGWYEAERKVSSKRETEVIEHLLDPRENSVNALHIGWDIDSNDWRYQNKKMTSADDKKFLQEIKKQVCRKKGGILLMHDHTEAVSRNLSCLIKSMRKAGHTFEKSPKKFKGKRTGSGGPQIVMEYSDIHGVGNPDEQNCEESEKLGKITEKEDLLGKLIEKLREQDEYTPPKGEIIKKNIYKVRNKSGQMIYKHVGTYKRFQSVDTLAQSKELKLDMQKKGLKLEDLTYFETDGQIQIGVKK